MSTPVFVYVDESGDLDFNKKGCSDYFAMAAMMTTEPVRTAQKVLELKYELMRHDIKNPYFHATEDTTGTRRRVFDLIDTLHTGSTRFHAIYADKHMAAPQMWDKQKFYGLFAGALAKYLAKSLPAEADPIVIVYDAALRGKDQKQFHAKIKPQMKELGRTVRIHFDSIRHDPNGQIADYAAWSLTRHLEARGNGEWERIRSKFGVTPFDVFRRNSGIFYW